MTDTEKRPIPSAPRPRAVPRSHRIGANEQAGSSRTVAIGDLAREFDISTRAIRFYEARGLLRPARRGVARVFGSADRQRLALIIRGKNLGLTLEEISEHLAIYDNGALGPTDHAALKARLDRHIATLTAKRHDLAAALKELRQIRARLVQREVRSEPR